MTCPGTSLKLAIQTTTLSLVEPLRGQPSSSIVIATTTNTRDFKTPNQAMSSKQDSEAESPDSKLIVRLPINLSKTADTNPKRKVSQVSSPVEATLKRRRCRLSAKQEVDHATARLERMKLSDQEDLTIRLWDEILGLKWKGEGWKALKDTKFF